MEFQVWKNNVLSNLHKNCIVAEEKKEKDAYQLKIQYEDRVHLFTFDKMLQKSTVQQLEDESWEVFYHYIHYREDTITKTTHLSIINKKTKFMIEIFTRTSLFNEHVFQFDKHFYSKETHSFYNEGELLKEEKIKVKKMINLIKEFEENHGPNRLAFVTGASVLEI